MSKDPREEKNAYPIGRLFILSNGGATVEVTSTYALPRLIPQFQPGDDVRLDEYHLNSQDPNFREGIWVSENTGTDDPIWGKIVTWEAVMVERAENRSWFGVGYIINVPVLVDQVRQSYPDLDLSYYNLPPSVDVTVLERFLLERNTRRFDWEGFSTKHIKHIFPILP